MKQLISVFILLALFIGVGAQTISFTPGEYSQGKLMPDGVVYDAWDWKTNVAGVKDRFPLSTFNQSQTQYKLVKLKAPVTLHWTKIEKAGTQDNPKWVGMNWLLSKEYNAEVGARPLAKTYIKENGQAIAAQIEAWKLGDITQPVIASTRYAYDMWEQIPIALWMNGGTYTITIPPWLEFVSFEFTDMGYSPSKTWVKMFDYSYQVNGKSVTITISPTIFFDTTGVRLRGLRSVGHIIARAVGTGDGYIIGVQEGYVFVE